ncbi:hypothetical protein BpHYR1_003898 [Brachionus plicatilis]|uniref:Uncharacterized protein n=1 Tax=Brachionus plicatilis TaxID=10195 RepID=A0A3M7PIU6_BRAPC|nr:hypothetical protein BpHYR1_003898 [Brachionus plicatilis]
MSNEKTNELNRTTNVILMILGLGLACYVTKKEKNALITPIPLLINSQDMLHF